MKDDSLDDSCDAALKELSRYKYEPDGVGKQEDCSNVYAKQIWNEAIEAAAKLIEYPTEEGPLYAATIRELKK